MELLKVASQNGLRVTGNMPLSIDLEEAIEAGLGGMQHVRNMDLACAKDAEVLLDERQISLENEDEIAGSASCHTLLRGTMPSITPMMSVI